MTLKLPDTIMSTGADKWFAAKPDSQGVSEKQSSQQHNCQQYDHIICPIQQVCLYLDTGIVRAQAMLLRPGILGSLELLST